MIAPLLALAVAACAAPAPVAGSPLAGEPYWFKTYSTAPYKETWTGELAMKDFNRDLPKAVAAIEKAGGKLTQPLANFVGAKDQSQQLTFDATLKDAKAALKALRKFGDIAEPATRPSGVPIPVAEVKAKIDAIIKEKSAHAAELAKVPAAAAAQEEILEHLFLVEEVARRSETGVRFNLLLRQK